MKRLALILLAATGLLMLAPSAQSQDARIYIIHGIPGEDVGLSPDLPVDVSVDGACTLAGFTFGEITAPLFLPAATYNIKISLADAQNPCSQPPLIDVDVPFTADETATVIAHLDEGFGLTASKFSNDVSRTGFLDTRLTVHHTAAVPAVDITLERFGLLGSGHVFVPNAPNGASAGVDRPAGLWSLSLAPAGTGVTVLGPQYLLAFPGRAYFGYVVGSLDNDTARVLLLSLRADG